MVSTVRVGENDDSEACDNILQIGHRLVRNGVQTSKSSKMSV